MANLLINTTVGGNTVITTSNIGTYALTSITSGQVTTALGFTPYNATNPSGYISSYTETSTLQNVTSRGNTTTTSISAANFQNAWQVLSLNNIKTPGLYNYDGGITGTQPLGTEWYNVRTIEIGADGRYSQFVMPYHIDRIFYRRKSDAGFDAYVELYHTGNLPTIPTNNNQLTNGAGYISSITSGNVTTALGFTPYNATNPNGYISSSGSISGNANTTSQKAFNDLKIDFPSGGSGGYSFGPNHYSMGLDLGNGAWNGPHYKDVIIGYHTGIRLGASYSGIRFYNNSPTTDTNNDGNGDSGEALLMTIGGYVGTANHTDVVVNNNLIANVSLRAPIFYDSADAAYYVDPNGNSVLTTATFNLNASSTLTLTSAGTNASQIKAGAGDELYLGGNNTWQMRFDGANVLMDNGGYLQNNESLRAPIFYDSQNTAYYGDFAGTSNLYNLSLTGAKSTYLTINPGNGYEAMIRYIGGSGSGWYVGKRMTGDLVNTGSFHFYSEAASATVAGIDTGGNFYTTGYLTIAGTQLTGAQTQLLKNTLDITSLPYKCDIYVEGNADTFYPVHFIYGNQDVWRRIIINRGYSETAPWDPIGTGAHHGGLLLDWEGNFGGWGGAEYSDRLRVFNESYTNSCADMYIYTHSMGYVFMLRGGHSIYHIYSDQPINGTYQSGSPDIAYSTATKFYDGGANPQYDVYAPAPLALNQVNSSRIDGLRTKKQSLLDGRYLRQGVDISGISNITSTNFLATNAFYLNSYNYYLNSTNGGIYTNARFETASNLFVGGNSYLGNGNGDETHINDILRVGATDSGDAHFYFGEGSLAGSDYGSHWYWDSAYRFTWNTRNAGTDTALFYYDTNSLSYITWNRSHNINANSIDYVGQLHFNGGTRFQTNDTHYLNFKTDATDHGSIQVRDGNNTLRGHMGYYDGNGFGLLNSSGTWGIRLNPGSTETLLFYAGDWRVQTVSGGTKISGNLYTNTNYGHGLVGLYSATRYQGVFAMSDDYKLTADGTGTGNLYGIAWTHTNVGGQSKSGLGHQALFMANGSTQTAIGYGIWTVGLITTTDYGTSANWNTAYSWGNHASAGYLTSLPSHNHDDRYYTESESDGRYAYKAGAAGQDFSADKLSSYYLRNNFSVTANHSYGMYFDNDLSSAYGIFRESGAWDHPYPDLRIAFHTGIKLGANSSYQGIKFYTDYDMVTQVMSVNNGSDPLGAGNVYVNNSLQAGSSLRAPIFYDTADTSYYGDFAGTSRLNNLYLEGGVASIYNASGYSSAAIEVRERNFGGAQDDTWATAPRIGFHWGGRVASQIALASNGRIHILNDPGTANEAFQAGIIYSSGYGDSTQWKTAYDWGNHASAGYVTSSALSSYLPLSGGTMSGHLNVSYNIASPSNYYSGLQAEIMATSGTAGIALHRSGYSHVGIYHDSTNELKFNFNGGTPILPATAGTLWGSGNLTNLNQLTNGPGYLTSITSGNVTTALGFTPYNATNPSGYISSITSGNVTTALGYTPYNATNPNGYITGISFASVSSKPTTISGYGITDALYQNRDTINVDAFNATGLYRGSTSGWSNRPTIAHNGGALFTIDTHPSDYHSQLFFDTGADRLYFRNANGGSWGSWLTMWHSGNLTNLNQLSNGPGYLTSSALSSYVPFSGGTLTEGNYFYFRSNRGAYLGVLDSPPLQVYATGGNAAFMSFHRGGNYAVNFGLDADNVMRIGGWSASSNRWQLDMSGNNIIAGNYYGGGAGLTGTASSLSVGYATTAGALSSMNISQFTNNSGYLTSVSDIWVNTTGDTMTGPLTVPYLNITEPVETFNPFGPFKMHDSILSNSMVGRWDRFDVTINGTLVPGASVNLSNQNFEEYNGNGLFGTDAGETKVFNINVQKLESGSISSTGITYCNGYFDICFYSSPFPASWSARVKDKDGNYTAVTSLTQIGNSKLRGIIPIGNWLTDIEFTLVARTSAPYVTSNITYGISEFELFFSRMAASQGGNISSIGGYLGGVITTSSGVTSSNWNTAFGWGNHASAGYQSASTAITTSNIGSQSVSYASTAGSAPNAGNINQFYDVTAGVGNGLRFWNGADSYKISMGVGALYQYGPVTDYSIKAQMNDGDATRGFTWGRISYAPIAALNSTSGDMEVAGYFKSYGYRGNGNVGGTGSASWHPDGIYCGSTMWQYGSLYKNNTGMYGVSEIQLNAGLYLQTYNDRNLIVKGNSSSDAGIEGRNAAGSNVFQIYGNGSDYGFLNGTWAGWDIKKTKNAAMYMNNNDSYYLQTNSTSNFYALNIQGNAVVHAGNIGSQSVSYASTAGSADQIDGWGFVNTGSNVGTNADTINSNGISYYVSGVTNFSGNSTDGALYSQRYSDSWQHQIAGDYRSGMIAVRGKNNGSWTSWRTIIDSSTIGSQSVSYASSAGSAATATTASNLAADTSTRFKILTFTGVGGDSGNGAVPDSYAIYQQGGSWTHPYPDLCIGYHTGIKIGANSGYNGTRFYNDSNWATEIFSVGNGDNHVRVLNNLYVGGNLALHAGNYNSYSPTLTGTGASGTWGISISGNAATATNVAYSGLTGTVPTWNQNTTGSAGSVGGYGVSAGVGANTVVIREGNGYVFFNYINSNVSETENPTINSFYTSNGDGYFRKSNVAHVKSQLGLGSMAYESSGTYQTVSGAINTGNIASQSVSYATISQQLTKFGDIYGQDWNAYFITGKLIVSNALGHTGPNRPSDSYGYGTALSYGETGGPLMQMYFPEDVANSGGAYKALAYRSGYNGGWSAWKTVVNQVGNTCTVAGSNGTGLQVHSNVGYNQNPLTYFLLRGQADSSWKTFKILLTGDAGGQDIEFRRIAENSTDARMFYVPRGANQVIFDYTVVQPSDSRLKDNLTPITTPVEKIKSLRGVEFDWNSGEHVGTHDVGLIAQDVEAVLPEAVTTQEDGYKNLAYTKVIPLLVEAMKEQQTMIEALRAEIELLKNK